MLVEWYHQEECALSEHQRNFRTDGNFSSRLMKLDALHHRLSTSCTSIICIPLLTCRTFRVSMPGFVATEGNDGPAIAITFGTSSLIVISGLLPSFGLNLPLWRFKVANGLGLRAVMLAFSWWLEPLGAWCSSSRINLSSMSAKGMLLLSSHLFSNVAWMHVDVS